MARLVTFGCSYTYGHGLEDCFEPPLNPGQQASKIAWPGILAKMLSVDYENVSRPGASNFEILNRILNFEFKKNDLIVVMWSFFARDMVFDDDGREKYLHINQDDEEIKSWVETHSFRDMMLRSWFYMHHASCYLREKSQDFYFLHVNHDPRFIKERPQWTNSVELLKTNFSLLSTNYDRALDNVHPGSLAHLVAAKLIFAEIKTRGLKKELLSN